MRKKKIKATITAYFDGCCEPVNPGGIASFGAVVFLDEKRIWECSKIFFPEKGKEKETSNNVAEYCGFISILEYLIENKLNNNLIAIYGDSKLVIEQMQGNWRMRQGYYIPFALKAKKLLKNFKETSLIWIPRDENSIADELSKAELIKAGVEFRIQPND